MSTYYGHKRLDDGVSTPSRRIITEQTVEKARRLVELINGAEQRHSWEYQQLLCPEEFAQALCALSETAPQHCPHSGRPCQRGCPERCALDGGPLSAIPASNLAVEELGNISRAQRFNRELFRDDTEFADWVVSRCNFTLGRMK